jgi:hypothetical protein
LPALPQAGPVCFGWFIDFNKEIVSEIGLFREAETAHDVSVRLLLFQFPVTFFYTTAGTGSVVAFKLWIRKGIQAWARMLLSNSAWRGRVTAPGIDGRPVSRTTVVSMRLGKRHRWPG